MLPLSIVQYSIALQCDPMPGSGHVIALSRMVSIGLSLSLSLSPYCKTIKPSITGNRFALSLRYS